MEKKVYITGKGYKERNNYLFTLIKH